MKRPLVKALAGAMLLLSHYSLALSSDTEQPIHIQSESQHLDMATNTVTFTQNVVLTQGSIKILADKLIVIRPEGQEGDETIEAYGKPATFEQTMDDGKEIHGEANKLRYEVGNEFLKMSTNAMLEQSGNQVEGNVITYEIDKQQLVAESDSTKRVTTILQPSTKSSSSQDASTSDEQ
ncbi:lipopolysaccharide transport periplasmic protein LptA [Salinivibrio sp. ML323]|uniref:Lipopolysaccharide export system protein LptA n=1 Tax=Salinivibrio kushneri TaxID=1908198 RepID=A0AB36JZ06_9GAMM|nr:MULTISPECIES: lipopolysaccharide transport periplasmic protein LptA [Salinivibrio]OOE40466.1 lipopolysaccharide transport periplasmic protein LptA [Salinivibrio kushneri]OOE60503.1 lipopolysaccharide transport periplasmic protein LptA [Salinivibrio sp. ML323]OOE66124.1 lipopolysaccharide transport periplasmic protein LptA [Salinivibrio kushneri]QCP01245.1 lipopolysaccharide transport periplasmic protein LptA [Salinivibrio kushneri]